MAQKVNQTATTYLHADAMRLIVITFAFLSLMAQWVSAETASPFFGGATSGTFQMTDQTAISGQNSNTVDPAASCTAPDCAEGVQTANLPVGRKKP